VASRLCPASGTYVAELRSGESRIRCPACGQVPGYAEWSYTALAYRLPQHAYTQRSAVAVTRWALLRDAETLG